MKSNKSELTRWSHNFGQFSGYAIAIVMALVPVIMSWYYGIWPKVEYVMPGFLALFSLMASFGIAECLAYPPIMGPAGVYMAYLTGNTSALKMPCAISAMKITDVKFGTDEGNAVAMLSVGISTLTVTIVIIMGVILAVPLEPVLKSPVLAPSINSVVPAILGALLCSVIVGNLKYYVLPLIAAVLLLAFTKINTALIIVILLAISLSNGFLLKSYADKKNKANLGEPVVKLES